MTVTSLSAVPLSEQCAIVFDLDDTLYAERDFVLSGFRAIAEQFFSTAQDQQQAFLTLKTAFDDGEADPFSQLLAQFPQAANVEAMLQVYRGHHPDISLQQPVVDLLTSLKSAGRPLGLLTDGRSSTQRSKIAALGLSRWIDEIVISGEFGSEKPDPSNYRHFQHALDATEFAYVGDNLRKDFVAPNRLGWTTIGLLDQGKNIHRQSLDETSAEYLPHYFVEAIA